MERYCSTGQSPQQAVAPTEEEEEEEEGSSSDGGEKMERELMTDREKWRGIVRQAKAHSRL
jgi:hypothetical protein